MDRTYVCQTAREEDVRKERACFDMMQQQANKLTERKSELQIEEELTEKQAAIIAAFESMPSETYSKISEEASTLLKDGESVTSSYASEQIQERRARWNDQETDTVSLDSISSKVGDVHTGNIEEMIEREDAEEVSVTLERGDWLRVSAFLLLLSQTSEGEKYENGLMESISKISEQAL